MVLARTLIALCILVFALALSAADAPRKPGEKAASRPRADITLNQDASGKTQEMKAGQVLCISLKGNPTTGYQWVANPVDGNAVEQVGDVEYVPDRAAQGLVGVGGTFHAFFRAVQVGKAKVSLQYVRPWEKNKPPAETFSLEITVQADAASRPASGPASRPNP